MFTVILLDMEGPENSQTFFFFFFFFFFCEGLGALKLSTFTLMSGVSV